MTDIIIYTKDELKSKSSKDIIDIMKHYSLKYSGLKKTQNISAILKYQQYVEDLKETLVENNPIDNYHRGHVVYALPAMLIYRIIRLIWRDELSFGVTSNNPALYNRDHLLESYRKLLPFALVSKELFNLVSSSLFTRIRIGSLSKQPYHYNKPIDSTLSNHFNNSIVNPHSVLKNIIHLDIDYKTFAKLVYDVDVNLRLKFGNIVSLTIKGSDDKVGIKQCEIISKYMPKLERFTAIRINFEDPKVLNAINEFQSLTALDVSRSSLTHITFSFEQLSKNIQSIKLPSKLVYQPTQSTFNFKTVQIPPKYITASILTDHLVKLIIVNPYYHLNLDILPQYFKDFLVSDNCKIKRFGLRCQTRFQNYFIQFMKETVANAKSIEALDLYNDFDYPPKNGLTGSLMFNMTVPMTNIKSMNIFANSTFFDEYNSYCVKEKEVLQPSGFTLFKWKLNGVRGYNNILKFNLKRTNQENGIGEIKYNQKILTVNE